MPKKSRYQKSLDTHKFIHRKSPETEKILIPKKSNYLKVPDTKKCWIPKTIDLEKNSDAKKSKYQKRPDTKKPGYQNTRYIKVHLSKKSGYRKCPHSKKVRHQKSPDTKIVLLTKKPGVSHVTIQYNTQPKCYSLFFMLNIYGKGDVFRGTWFIYVYSNYEYASLT